MRGDAADLVPPPHPAGEVPAAHGAPRPAAAARLRTRRLRLALRGRLFALQPHPDANLLHPLRWRRERAHRRAHWLGQDHLRRVRLPAAAADQPGRPLRLHRAAAVARRRAVRRMEPHPRRARGRARRAAHWRDGERPEAARARHACRRDAAPVGPALAPVEAAQERAERRAAAGRRDAPHRRRGRPRPRGGHLADAIHLVAHGVALPHRRALHLACQRQGPGRVGRLHAARHLQLPLERAARATRAAHPGLRHRACAVAPARHVQARLLRRRQPRRRPAGHHLRAVGQAGAADGDRPAHVRHSRRRAAALPARRARGHRPLREAPQGAGAARDGLQRHRLSARGARRRGAARRLRAARVGRGAGARGDALDVLGAQAARAAGGADGHAVLRRRRAPVCRLPDHRHPADDRARVPPARRRVWPLRAAVPRAEEALLPQVFVRALPRREPPGPLPARPPLRRGGHQDDREQAGRRRLPHVDLHVPPADAEPQLLQPAGRLASPPLRPPVRARRDDAHRPRAGALRRHRGRDGGVAAQPGHDRLVLLHPVHDDRALLVEPAADHQAQGPRRDPRLGRRVRRAACAAPRRRRAAAARLALPARARGAALQRPARQGQRPAAVPLLADGRRPRDGGRLGDSAREVDTAAAGDGRRHLLLGLARARAGGDGAVADVRAGHVGPRLGAAAAAPL
mmetsp:Transcript_13446/g.42942  ORF Transcript_13446/g.42942 Transcript_13446/m.42942 type:complete len:688 (+) Transcript_13446:4009-6072(+)